MDENNFPSSFEPSDYLSSSQIEILRNKVLDSRTFDEQFSLLNLLDGFVRSNGKEDENFRRLRNYVQASYEFVLSQNYPMRVAGSFPILFEMAYFDLIFFVGILTETDVEDFQKKAGLVAGMDLPHTTYKA